MITYDEMGNVVSSDSGDDIASPTEWAASQWQDAVIRWQNTIGTFSNQLQTHYDLYPAAAALGGKTLADWQLYTDRANTVKSAIETLQSKLAATSTWAKNTLGLASLQQMGVLPLVPIAVIVGSVATVSAITYAIYSYDSQLSEKWNYINSHPELTNEQVNQILDSGGGGLTTGVAGDMKNIMTWAIVGAAAFILGPQIINAIKHKGTHDY